MSGQFDYLKLKSEIERLDCWYAPSEMQGMLSAFTAFGGEKYIKNIFILDKTEEEKFVNEVQKEISEQLQDIEFGYQLVLEEEAMPKERAEQFVSWIYGFLNVFAFLQQEKEFAPQIKQLEADINEYIQDIKEFSKLDTNLEPSDANLTMLLNLEEYCRMGVIMIYIRMHSAE